MFKTAKIFYLHSLSPTHVGSGSDLGVVDMPIQREGHTGFPKIEASSLKGSVRSAIENNAKDDESRKKIHMAFGYDDNHCKESIKEAFKDRKSREFAGALGFSDARILLFPIKSAKDIFAWITCPMVLNRFIKDSALANNAHNFSIIANTTTQDSSINIDESSVILEEYQVTVQKNAETQKIAEFIAQELDNDEIKTKLIILSNDDFKDFILLSTEIITRTKINNETGVVQDGALFTEEYLPCETILYALALASPVMATVEGVNDLKTENDVMDFLQLSLPDIMQIGGNATIGKGIVSAIIGENNVN